MIGTTTTSSWLLKPPEDPFGAKTPTMRKFCRLIFITWPIGSAPLKRLVATVGPITATLLEASTSPELKN